METTKVYWGIGLSLTLGVMEKKMETTIMENQMEKKMENEMETREYMRIIIFGYIGIMAKKMETSIVYCGILGYWKRKWKLV